MDRRTDKSEERIRELTGELEALSYSISHDLRAPLRAVTGFSRILLGKHSEKLDAEGRELLEMVHDGARTLDGMIEALLEYSRVERKAMTLSALNMDELADEQIALCRSKISGRNVRFIRTGLAGATGDREMIGQALACLLDNALKFTRDREEALIEVGSAMNGGEIRYQVRDNGVGFNPDQSGRLFRIFQRLHPADRFEGVGSGLAIARRICERHGGKIWADSQPGSGAVFYFNLG
jgi:light-regulated signal transduction histidine kinase (bacteriophytochrome)